MSTSTNIALTRFDDYSDDMPLAGTCTTGKREQLPRTLDVEGSRVQKSALITILRSLVSVT